MFTGIIESVGKVLSVSAEGTNKTFVIEADLDDSIKVDQSISHNGVCLTVTSIAENNARKEYSVTAIAETLEKSNLGDLADGDLVNIERCMRADSRVDGHFVQGHVDCTGIVKSVQEMDGSWEYRFTYPAEHSKLIVSKGSISVNGVSLTVVDPTPGEFGVAIIPFTYQHTNFQNFKEGDRVNLEFDILGKYVIGAMANSERDN